jgi:signal transduction histidine kinase
MTGGDIGGIRTRILNLWRVQHVPVRALTLSLAAMGAAIAGAAFFPQALINQESLAGGLALLPALLLSHYRGWPIVTILLAVGLVALTGVHLTNLYDGNLFQGPFLILFVVAPYISIALGAGWFGEVRRYQDELRAAQLQLIQSEKLESLGRLSAGVAHELKNPLMMMLTGVQILTRRQANGDEQIKQLLKDMANAVERADKIISGLLNYSRDGGLNKASKNLNTVIEQSVGFVKHELGSRISVATQLHESLPQLMLDEFKIQQVFVNLLINAIHAIDGQGEIRITTSIEKMARGPMVGFRKTDRYVPGEAVVMVKVEDSGTGIPQENLKKVFDPFFTTKPTGKGTGLGLSVSRQIVEMHDGTLDIGNSEEGGACATMVFKVEQKGAAA